MSKKLAIMGHPTRGEEVIKLLEMMGGVAAASKGFMEIYCYYISEDTATNYISWDYVGPEKIDKYKIFTLEEFLEKYPFKVGDKVVYTKFGDNCDDYPIIVKSMKWTGTTIEYAFDGYMTCLAKDLKMWDEEPDAVIAGINLNRTDYADEVEINLGDYEIEVRDGRTFAVLKKPKYPTTYEECCKILGCKADHFFTNFSHNGLDVEISDYEDKIDVLLENFRKLRYYRDAYWKIAGEQMGLDKPWKPDWVNGRKEEKYCIATQNNEIWHNFSEYGGNEILAFPTIEMRDAFYENFKDLIEECKELL